MPPDQTQVRTRTTNGAQPEKKTQAEAFDVADSPLFADAEGLVAMQDAAEEAAELLRSIGSAHRLIMLCLLAEGPRTVTEICTASGMRQSLASQHLARLRLDGLVNADRQGHFVSYSLSSPIARDIISVLYRHLCGAKTEAAEAKSGK